MCTRVSFGLGLHTAYLFINLKKIINLFFSEYKKKEMCIKVSTIKFGIFCLIKSFSFFNITLF